MKSFAWFEVYRDGYMCRCFHKWNLLNYVHSSSVKANDFQGQSVEKIRMQIWIDWSEFCGVILTFGWNPFITIECIEMQWWALRGPGEVKERLRRGPIVSCGSARLEQCMSALFCKGLWCYKKDCYQLHNLIRPSQEEDSTQTHLLVLYMTMVEWFLIVGLLL